MSDLLIESFRNLRANKLRSFLTMFGIMWGVISIVVLSAASEGFTRGNREVLQELGKNIVIIRNGRTSLQAGGERAGRNVRLTIADALVLKNKARLIEHVSPELMRSGLKVKSAFNTASLQASGIWPVFQTIRTLEDSDGRLINQADCDQRRRVVLIGYEAARMLFADRDPIGQPVTLNGITYSVVGRIRKKKQDSNYTGQDDERLFVPYEAMRMDFPMTGEFDTPDSLSAIIASAQPAVAEELRQYVDREKTFGIFRLSGRTPVEAEIRQILAPLHGFDVSDTEAISFWNTTLESVFFDKTMKYMDDFFVIVSLITLALGGIGVMNIMLVAVRERTHEIGIRKALGAAPRVIQWQFFSEGLFLTILSGGIGLGIGYGLCQLVNLLPRPGRFSGMIVTWPVILFSIGAFVVVGVLAATYPARRAAALPPVEALRYDM